MINHLHSVLDPAKKRRKLPKGPMSNTAEASRLRLGATSQEVQRSGVQRMVDMLTTPVVQ